MSAIEALQKQLKAASSNNSALQRQQVQLMESVHTLITMVTSTAGTHTHSHTHTPVCLRLTQTSSDWSVVPLAPPLQSQMWKDCADVYKAGYSVSGVYSVYIANRTEPTQVNTHLYR